MRDIGAITSKYYFERTAEPFTSKFLAENVVEKEEEEKRWEDLFENQYKIRWQAHQLYE